MQKKMSNCGGDLFFISDDDANSSVDEGNQGAFSSPHDQCTTRLFEPML